LHNTLSDCAYLFKNLRFLTVTVSEIVEQLKKYTQSLIMSLDLVLSIFPKQLVATYCNKVTKIAKPTHARWVMQLVSVGCPLYHL